MDTSEIANIKEFHVAIANLRSMTMSERPVDVEVAIVGNGGTSLKIEITSVHDRALLTLNLDYINGRLKLSHDVFPQTNPAYLVDIAYAVQFAARVYDLVKVHPDY